MIAAMDVFAEAKERYLVTDLWRALNLQGTPKPSCKSPFRDERNPSFSIFDQGRAWKDHGTGEGGDVIEFVRVATGWSHSEIREWFMERLGIDHPEPTTTRVKAPRKEIEWPCELVTGSPDTWTAFAKRRGLSYPAVWTMVHAGILRFGIVDGHKCFIITDDKRRAAEIRRIDGKPFGNDRKAYPLRGVDKSWLVGAALLDNHRNALVVEGATDLLAAYHLYVTYWRAGGNQRWCPMALLGGLCKTIDPSLLARLKGGHVRAVPDADQTGDAMRENLRELFTKAGCTFDSVNLPRGTDLTDCKDQLSPGDLFA